MLKKFTLVLVMMFMQNFCWATMFFPLPFEKQIEEASSGVEVRLGSSRVFKNALGTIMTEYSFDVLEAYNLSDDDLENQKLKLTMPGGSFEGITSVIDGAPEFRPEEKSFLLLKKIDSKIYLSNFTLGKFKIQVHEGKTYYVSEVFPMDANIGRIQKEKMIELMRSKWKTSFSEKPGELLKTTSDTPKLEALSVFFKNAERRQPAQEMEVNRGVPFFFWSSIGVLLVFFTFIFFKLSKRDN